MSQHCSFGLGSSDVDQISDAGVKLDSSYLKRWLQARVICVLMSQVVQSETLCSKLWGGLVWALLPRLWRSWHRRRRHHRLPPGDAALSPVSLPRGEHERRRGLTSAVADPRRPKKRPFLGHSPSLVCAATNAFLTLCQGALFAFGSDPCERPDETHCTRSAHK